LFSVLAVRGWGGVGYGVVSSRKKEQTGSGRSALFDEAIYQVMSICAFTVNPVGRGSG
jgi:hypothetical protein